MVYCCKPRRNYFNLVDDNASALGSAVGISSGTYFIRGTFVDVSTDKIVLDPYTNDSSYKLD